MPPKPNPRLMRGVLAVCVGLVLAHVIAWFVFGFSAYTLLSFASAILTGMAMALGLRELRKRE